MNVSAVQDERGPRKLKLKCAHATASSIASAVGVVATKKSNGKKSFASKNSPKVVTQQQQQQHQQQSQATTTKTTEAVEMTTCSGHQEIVIQILLTCLKQAQQSECFAALSKYQQNVILRNVWSELFVLKASHWPIDIIAAIESCGDGHLLDIIRATKTLCADLMELSLLEVLILSRPEFAVDAKERQQLQCNLENAISRLAVYVSSQHQQHHQPFSHRHQMLDFTSTSSSHSTPSVMRFGKLLLGLRHLSMHFHESSLNNLFRNIAEESFQL